jgi:hypothetical protein
LSQHKLRVGLLLLILLLLFGVGVKEYYHPYLVLFLDDWIHPKPAPLNAWLDEDVALRLYPHTRPHVGKIGSLQKGLVLVHRGQELVEEGFGFGAPIIQVGDVAYLSRHAEVSFQEDGSRTTLVKTYTMDVADRPTRFLKVKYQDVAPLGTVVFSYTLQAPDTITVEVDFTGLKVDWDRAYLMNEQGALNFGLYRDQAGQTWTGEQIGRWRPLEDSMGCWLAQERSLRFCVEVEPGRRLFVGRERYNQYRWTGIFYLAWSGVDIEIDPPVPHYRYVIRVEVEP